MKKVVINVPKDKCALDHLAQMGERTKNAWIFLHENAIEKMKLEESCMTTTYPQYEEIVFKATEENPATIVSYKDAGIWKFIYRIDAEDIAFTDPAEDPEEIYFLKMKE